MRYRLHNFFLFFKTNHFNLNYLFVFCEFEILLTKCKSANDLDKLNVAIFFFFNFSHLSLNSVNETGKNKT